jgi:copper transport protein
MLASFLLDGHTRTAEPMWLLWVADAIHVLAAAAWAGGLVVLASNLRDRRRSDDPSGAAAMVAGFSGIAMTALLVVTVAGLAMSWALVRQPRALTSTDYGWTLAVKVGLVAVLALVGAYNRRQLVPLISRTEDEAGADAAWRSLRGTVGFEVLVVALVIAVTAFLVNLRPAAEAAGITGAFDTVVAVDEDLSVNLVVDPNRVGLNEIHLYVFDATGRPTGDLSDVTLNLTHPERDIGPIEREAFVAGPGHWQVTGRDLAVPGRWLIEVVIGIDRFTTATTEVEVVVNP